VREAHLFCELAVGCELVGDQADLAPIFQVRRNTVAQRWGNVMRIFVVAIIVAALTAPALAQMGGGAGGGRGGEARRPGSSTVEDPAKKKAEERAFNDALKRIPASEKKYDPWGNIREAPKH
jgi:hypothetical protein